MVFAFFYLDKNSFLYKNEKFLNLIKAIISFWIADRNRNSSVNEIFPYERVIKRDGEVIKFDNIGRDIIAQSKVKKVLYKATYCVHCGACEVECPTGALKEGIEYVKYFICIS